MGVQQNGKQSLGEEETVQKHGTFAPREKEASPKCHWQYCFRRVVASL